MSSYYFKCRKDTEGKSPKVVKAKNGINGRIMVLSNCVGCGSKKSKFIKEQEANGLLSQIPLLGPLFLEIFAS